MNIAELNLAVTAMLASALEGTAHDIAYRHFHEWDAAKLRTLRVAVTPRGADAVAQSRSTMSCDYRVGIVIAKYAPTQEEAEEVFRVAEAVLDAINANPVIHVTSGAGIGFSSASVDFSADESLAEQNVYRATVEVTYKVLKG